jgi:hypothetical protein
MNVEFLNTLSGINKVLYKTSYEFHMKYSANATEESAHQAGLDKIKSVSKLSEELDKPQTYVNLSTGKRFTCTENQLTAKYA